MLYFLRRSLYALRKRRHWLLLALFPPLVYAAVSMLGADSYVVYTDLTVVSERQLNPAAVHNLISVSTFNQDGSGKFNILWPSPERRVYFQLPAPNTVRITYEGRDPVNGADIVNLYADRLGRNVLAGEQYVNGPSQLATGGVVTEGVSALWRPERTVPFLQYAGISLLIVIAGLIFFEFMDPTFRSERNAARYLDIPMLGSLPDAEKILKAMQPSARQKADDAEWARQPAGVGVPESTEHNS